MSGIANLPPQGNLVVRAAEWEDGKRPGERIRRLIDDPAGYRTMVMTIGPGPLGRNVGQEPARAGMEQILEGELHAQGLGAGGVRRPVLAVFAA
jgi:hypothetical protein